MPEKIFINYRRQTDRDAAGRLRDRLESVFSEEGVFIDVDNIHAGEDFGEVISASIAQCDIFLSVIGPRWPEVKDGEGRRRLDSPNDWVRIEIQTALRQKKVIIPVLLDHAEMPSAPLLPKSLARLARINAAALTYESYGQGIRKLIEDIKYKRAEANTRAKREEMKRTEQEARARQEGTARSVAKAATAEAPGRAEVVRPGNNEQSQEREELINVDQSYKYSFEPPQRTQPIKSGDDPKRSSPKIPDQQLWMDLNIGKRRKKRSEFFVLCSIGVRNLSSPRKVRLPDNYTQRWFSALTRISRPSLTTKRKGGSAAL